MTDLQILKSGESFTSEELADHKLCLDLFEVNVPKMGFKTEGSERLFFAALFAALEGTEVEPFIAFEIGTATGLTTRAIEAYIMPMMAEFLHYPWKVISCDLPDGWSLNVDQLKKNLPSGSVIDATENMEHSLDNHVVIYLSPSEKVLASPVVPHINFAFVDGCHCHQCVMKDFLNVKEKLVENGIIVFHDTGRSIQSEGQSKHGLDMIYARTAVEDILGSFGDYYELLANLESDSNQNGMIIVRKR